MTTSTYSESSALPKKQLLNWELDYTLPESNHKKTTIAKVPGSIQQDIARAEAYGPYYYAENWKDYLWMENVYFTYRARFNKPSLGQDQIVRFISKGIDYAFEILINGTSLLKHEGMFTETDIDITHFLLNENILEILIHPAPKTQPLPADRTQANQSVKPAVSYGWDWHPRLIPAGIWDDTYLEVSSLSRIENSHIQYNLHEDLQKADIRAFIEGKFLKGLNITWNILDPQDQLLHSKTGLPSEDIIHFNYSLDKPELWWPHDHGNQSLYTFEIELRNAENHLIGKKTEKTGFRRIRLLMNEGAWDSPTDFPKSRSVAPIQFEINNRKIFAKGSNWVLPEIFPGSINSERYDELTNRALEANFNILRVWGGGIVNKEAFYKQCDEKGILIWQEFPLACNNYLGTPGYLAILKQEARSIIKKLRKHASLVLWSGGNELFNAWSGMTDQSHALRLLNSLCLELDPETPYMNTSPQEGMGHGPYVFRDANTNEEVYSMIKRSRFTAYSEFGMPSPSPVEVLKSIIPENELWPPEAGTSWESHHAYNAWVEGTWLMQGLIEDYFGKAEDIEELIKNGQTLQSEGYKAIFEEARRQKPYCSMALNWCFNEPWPSAANTSIINWPDIPKPAFFAVKNACKPVLASARISKLQWEEGEVFAADLFLLNDLHKPVSEGKMSLTLQNENEKLLLLEWNFYSSLPNENIAGPTARCILPKWENTNYFILKAEVSGHPEYNSEYVLLYKLKKRTAENTALLNQ